MASNVVAWIVIDFPKHCVAIAPFVFAAPTGGYGPAASDREQFLVDHILRLDQRDWGRPFSIEGHFAGGVANRDRPVPTITLPLRDIALVDRNMPRCRDASAHDHTNRHVSS